MSPNKTCVCKVCGSIKSFKKPNYVCSAACRIAYKAMLAEQQATQTSETTQSNQSAILEGANNDDTPTKD